MNRMASCLIMLALAGPALLGDGVDEGLSLQATERLKAHTRSMIQAGVAARDALRMTRALEDRGVDTGEIIRAQEIVIGALRAGLPSGPLIDKALEGLAKNVPPQDITRALERTRARYEHAYRSASALTAPGADAARTGDALAEALAAGLSEPDADRIQDQLRTRERDQVHRLAQQSYLTARMMAGRRVASATVADTICAALQARYRTEDMMRLRTLFAKRAQLENATQVAVQYMKRLKAGASPRELEAVGGSGRGTGSSQPGGSSGSRSGGHGSGGKGPGRQ